MYSTLHAMGALLAQTPHLQRLGRLFCETILLKIDHDEFYLTFEKGVLIALVAGPSRKTPWRFSYSVEASALAKFWEACPDPGFHDIFGLVKTGHAKIDGDILMLVKNLRFFKEFLALGRQKVVS